MGHCDLPALHRCCVWSGYYLPLLSEQFISCSRRNTCENEVLLVITPKIKLAVLWCLVKDSDNSPGLTTGACGYIKKVQFALAEFTDGKKLNQIL